MKANRGLHLKIDLPKTTEPLWLQGDVLDRLADIPDDSIQCVVTSPPYWNLRDYNVDGQIGLEATLREWLDKMVEVFREVRRVLRPDGCMWLNCGDAYTGNNSRSVGGLSQKFSARGTEEMINKQVDGLKPKDCLMMDYRLALALQEPIWTCKGCNEINHAGKWGRWPNGRRICPACNKSKGVSRTEPGWWIRSKIVWAKPNPMPESVTDRPTSSYEMIFLLTKSARYFFDADAIREGYSEATIERLSQPTFDSQTGGPKDPKSGNRSPRKALENLKTKHAESEYGGGGSGFKGHSGYYDVDGNLLVNPTGRNSRNVWVSSTELVQMGIREQNEDPVDIWTIATHPNPKAHFACVDEETECLTINGWKRYDEIEIGEEAAQYDIATGLLSWGKVEDVATYRVENQEMVEGYCRDLRLLLTPNHRCVIFRRQSKTRKRNPPEIIRADELKPSHQIPTTAYWEDIGIDAVPIEWAELLGWYISEGHQCKNSSSVEIYQSETANEDNCQRIEYLLNATEIEWVKALGKRAWRGKEAISAAYKIRGYGALRLREMAPDKILQTDILCWNTRLCEALLNGLIGGDGHTRLDGRVCYVQKGKDAIDLIHALAIRCGYSACVSERMAPGLWTCYLTKHRIRSFRGTRGKGGNLRTVSYSGIIWCPKLPKGTWVARRQGRVFITGNTFPPELVRRCIAAGTSEKGCCPKCGKPWERVTKPAPEHASKRKDYRVMRFDAEGIGAYISTRLTEKGMSQSELATHFPSRTGGKTGCVHNWVTGKNIPTGKQWAVIKQVLDLDDRYDLLLESPATGGSISYASSGMANELIEGKKWSGPTPGFTSAIETLGWRPGCNCEKGRYPSTRPCIVLDPFAGIGTTLAVAARMKRRSIGIELNQEYIEMGLPDCEAAFRGITAQEVIAGQGTLFDDS